MRQRKLGSLCSLPWEKCAFEIAASLVIMLTQPQSNCQVWSRIGCCVYNTVEITGPRRVHDCVCHGKRLIPCSFGENRDGATWLMLIKSVLKVFISGQLSRQPSWLWRNKKRLLLPAPLLYTVLGIEPGSSHTPGNSLATELYLHYSTFTTQLIVHECFACL